MQLFIDKSLQWNDTNLCTTRDEFAGFEVQLCPQFECIANLRAVFCKQTPQLNIILGNIEHLNHHILLNLFCFFNVRQLIGTEYVIHITFHKCNGVCCMTMLICALLQYLFWLYLNYIFLIYLLTFFNNKRNRWCKNLSILLLEKYHMSLHIIYNPSTTVHCHYWLMMRSAPHTLQKRWLKTVYISNVS